MHKISYLSESSTVDFQITGRGNVTPEIHSFLSKCENFNKLLIGSASILLMDNHQEARIGCKQLPGVTGS